jgi:tetratricopeptide (TPR) repeat protein
MMTVNLAIKKQYNLLLLKKSTFSSLKIYLILIIITMIAFEPVRQNDFVSYDDSSYITKNTNIKTGINFKSLEWAFRSFHSANWHPLTWISHMLDYEMFGLNSTGHHLVNLLLHIMNSLLLLWILMKMTAKRWLSITVAILFAIHPLHVESVAWAAERKDVLSTFFGMLTIAAYFYYTRVPNFKRYLLVFFLFFLGLLAKPMLVTLPLLLLLLDYWPLERFPLSNDLKSSKGVSNNGQFFKLVIEKIPLFILTVASSIITFYVQKSEGAVVDLEKIPLDLRIYNALNSYLLYMYKLVYPKNLAIFYPYTAEQLTIWRAIIFFIILTGITIWILYLGKKKKYLIVGWLWYLITLVPVLGIIQVGGQAMADRYTYIPSIGFFIVIVWGVQELSKNWYYRKWIIGSLMAFVLISFLLLTRMQVKYWRSDFSLFKHAIDITDNNYVMHNNYGDTFYDYKMYDQALFHFKKALVINPNFTMAQKNICKVFLFNKKVEQAIACYHKVLQSKKEDAQIYHNLGYAYVIKGNDSLAIQYIKKALAIKPDYPLALFNLGEVLKKQGKYYDAIEKWQILLKNKPDIPEDYTDKPFYLKASIKIPELFYQKGEIAKAIDATEQAIQLADFLKNKKVCQDMKKQIEIYKNMLRQH